MALSSLSLVELEGLGALTRLLAGVVRWVTQDGGRAPGWTG